MPCMSICFVLANLRSIPGPPNYLPMKPTNPPKRGHKTFIRGTLGGASVEPEAELRDNSLAVEALVLDPKSSAQLPQSSNFQTPGSQNAELVVQSTSPFKSRWPGPAFFAKPD